MKKLGDEDTFWMKESRDGYAKPRFKRIGGVVVLIVCIVSGFIMLGLSFKSVEYNQYALKQNVFTKQIDDVVYEEGLHFIGFWNQFIVFPSTYITVEFTPASWADDIPISVQTKNGLLVRVDVSFQFKIREADLLQLYSDYGMAYKSYIQAVARSSLRAVVGDNNAEVLYANRSMIIGEMSTAIHNSLNSIVEVGEFQLRSIDFPQTFEDAVEQYEVWRIQVEINQLEQEAEIIKQTTLSLVAEYTANRTIIEYQGIADALENLRLTLNMTTEQMLTYLWIDTIREHDQAYLFIGLTDFPMLIPINGTLP